MALTDVSTSRSSEREGVGTQSSRPLGVGWPPAGGIPLEQLSPNSPLSPFPCSLRPGGLLLFPARTLLCPCGFPRCPAHTSVNSPFIKLFSSHPVQIYLLFLPGTLIDRDLVEMRERYSGTAGQAEPRETASSKALRRSRPRVLKEQQGAARVGGPEQGQEQEMDKGGARP